MVYEALINNLGAPGLNCIIAAFSMPPISQGKFDRYATYLYERMENHYEDMMKKGIEAVVQHYRNTGVEPDAATGYLDIAVSYDGTWLKRGHTSHIGASFVTEVETGMVIDFEVLWNVCPVCSKKNLSAEWVEKHRPLCFKNFDGLAINMETEAATCLRQRHTQYKLRYTTFLGDGDSSAFNAVCARNNGQGLYDVPVQPRV